LSSWKTYPYAESMVITKVRGKPLECVPVKLDGTFSEVVPSFRPVLWFSSQTCMLRTGPVPVPVPVQQTCNA